MMTNKMMIRDTYLICIARDMEQQWRGIEACWRDGRCDHCTYGEYTSIEHNACSLLRVVLPDNHHFISIPTRIV